MNGLARELLPGTRAPGTLSWMIAATAFLTIIALAAAIGLARAGGTLARAGADRATLYVVDADPARRDALAARALAGARRTPGVASATRVPDAAMARLLEPTIGREGLATLPLPALIELRLTPRADAGAIARQPGVELVRGDAGLAPLAALVATLSRLAETIALIAVAATILVAILAARTALDAHEATVATLHALGASDRDLAQLVQRRTARDALIGGAIGLAGGLAVTWIVGGRLAALGGNAGLGLLGWLALVAAPLILAGLATLAARLAVLGQLERAT